MIEVIIDSVRVNLMSPQRLVILREPHGERYLPIWVGPYEAEAITIALQDVEVARPQTHDLLKNTLKALSARLIRVEVVALKEDVYYGNLVVEANERIIHIDSRPSDALALAVRAHVPILIAREVMDTAGVEPERDIQSQDAPAAASAAPDSEERLSVFEDFLQNLSLDDTPPEDDEDKPDEDEPKPDK
jgi:hypothetical protein